MIETAHRALQDSSQVLRYAVAIGKAASNPARDLKGALKRADPKHFPAILDPKRLGELLRAIDSYAATPVVRAALKLAPMLLLRPGELRFAEWPEIDLDAALWTVPAARMKRELRQKLHGAPHLVPLPRQAVAVLRDLHQLTGHAKMVFRGERHHDRAMSENTINAALRAMGFSADEVTGHGFRATARTMLHERLGFRSGCDRGAARALGARQPGSGLQPDRVRRPAPQDAASVGGLPGQAPAGCRRAADTQGQAQTAAIACAAPGHPRLADSAAGPKPATEPCRRSPEFAETRKRLPCLGAPSSGCTSGVISMQNSFILHGSRLDSRA